MDEDQERRSGHLHQQRPSRLETTIEDDLVIDGVLTTQPELGPSVPDGGYGWVVFFATLFFQALIPSLIVSFGIFLLFSRLQSITKEDIDPFLWDDKLIYAPLFFIGSWTFFDPAARSLISTSTWPRLVATSGTCLTCAGLLFLWMGMAGYGEKSFFPLAGVISGIGASIQMSQCEIILAQYFRLKHTFLAYFSQAVSALGFVIAPIIIGHHVLQSSLLNVILWYQAIIIQGLIFSLTFKKPAYLKSKQRQATNRYNYHLTNPDDEEDILSKNSRELQIKRQDSSGTNVTIVKHELPPTEGEVKKNWETFEGEEYDDDDDEGETTKYEVLNQDWETFDEDGVEVKKPKREDSWVKFEDENETAKNSKPKNLQLELSFAGTSNGALPQSSSTGHPMPLFSDSPVNNNTSYSYDTMEQDPGARSDSVVFAPLRSNNNESYVSSLEILRRPTFYKSLLTVMTTKFSIFVYYCLFPSYMYQEVSGLRMKSVATVIGLLSVANVLFSAISYWINVDKKRRPICMWLLCWIGSFGYFMTSDSTTEQVLIMGAVQITVSIATLQYVGMPLLGLTLRGETNKEFNLISVMTGMAFIFFLLINVNFKNCFRLMALLHFFTGAVWFANYVYKKIMK